MDIPIEILRAISKELRLYQLVLKQHPDTPIKELHYCACVGPAPPKECLCQKQSRLIQEFINLVESCEDK